MVNTQTIPASPPAQDPITRDFTHISTESPESRRLTVGYGLYRVRSPDGGEMSVPLLRLQGAWLERAGFLVGRMVKVSVSFGQLVIEAAEPERIPKAEVLETIARVSEGGLSKRELDDLERRLRRLGRSD
jgi:Toxin SymE, type I toxin-antitoxin system